MSLLVVRLYAEIAILLAAGLVLGTGALALARRIIGAQPARSWLRVGYVLLCAALALPLLTRALAPSDAFFPAPMQIWSGSSGAGAPVSVAFTGLASPTSPARAVPSIGAGVLATCAALLVGASLFGLGSLARAGRRLWRICGRATPIRVVGRVTVAVSDEVTVPFSAWMGRRVWVVLPEAFVLSPAHLRLAVAHELGHVRARDTGWAYLTALVDALFRWHPAARLWAHWVARLQELSCDQRLCARRNVSARSYAECLLWAAELAQGARRLPGLAVPMLEGSRSFLERRITMLLSPSSSVANRRLLVPIIGAGALAALAVTAAASHGAVADRRISASEVEAIAADLASQGGLRVPVDETVVDEVNRVVSRPEAREKFRAGLERLRTYRPVGEEALRRHGLPRELVAMAQVESRVQPLPATMNRLGCAGIWQFLPATARKYGLRVDATADDRFDAAREVDAAARFLTELHADFRDWPLAIAAYNNGRPRVRAALTKTGASNAAALVKAGAISNYSSQVLAAMLLAHRPALVE